MRRIKEEGNSLFRAFGNYDHDQLSTCNPPFVICVVQILLGFLAWLHFWCVFLCMCSVFVFCVFSCVPCSKPHSTLQNFVSPVSRHYKAQNKLTRSIQPYKITAFSVGTPNLSPDRLLCFLQVSKIWLPVEHFIQSAWTCQEGHVIQARKKNQNEIGEGSQKCLMSLILLFKLGREKFLCLLADGEKILSVHLHAEFIKNEQAN